MVKELVVRHDIVYARAGVKPLKYDVYTPQGARNLPIVVVIHGGGWTANDDDIRLVADAIAEIVNASQR